MRCQVSGCCEEVADFELVPLPPSSYAVSVKKADNTEARDEIAFEFDEELVRSSTPRPHRQNKSLDKEIIVLRIDNVPWVFILFCGI